MIITILPKHMLGNSWSHNENPEMRLCPLYEAMVEAGMTDVYVGGLNAEGYKDGIHYVAEFTENSPWFWKKAKDTITRVNNGEELSVDIEFEQS